MEIFKIICNDTKALEDLFSKMLKHGGLQKIKGEVVFFNGSNGEFVSMPSSKLEMEEG